MVRRIAAWLFALGLLVWLCAPVIQAQEKPVKLYVGVAGLSGALAHAFIPKDSGLYEKYGLDVELIFFQGGTQAIQSTLAGGVQMVVTAGPEIISARVAGSDMTIIAGYMNTLPYSIVAGKASRSMSSSKVQSCDQQIRFNFGPGHALCAGTQRFGSREGCHHYSTGRSDHSVCGADRR